jgi:hypothetical protein
MTLSIVARMRRTYWEQPINGSRQEGREKLRMSYEQTPDDVSYDMLLQKLFNRSLAGLDDDELVYFLELVQRLRELKERTDTEAWWFRYYR